MHQNISQSSQKVDLLKPAVNIWTLAVAAIRKKNIHRLYRHLCKRKAPVQTTNVPFGADRNIVIWVYSATHSPRFRFSLRNSI